MNEGALDARSLGTTRLPALGDGGPEGSPMGYWSRFARQGDLDKGAQGLAGECLFDGRIAST
jgi:hypothetical protein